MEGGAYLFLQLPEPVCGAKAIAEAMRACRGAQGIVRSIAAAEGMESDVAFKQPSSLVRVPLSPQSKYLHSANPVVSIPGMPEGDAGVLTPEQVQFLAAQDPGATEGKQEKRKEVESARRKRHGGALPRVPQRILGPHGLQQEPSGIWRFDTCPCCGQSEGNAWIHPSSLRLKCYRATCEANAGMKLTDWAKRLGLKPKAVGELQRFQRSEQAHDSHVEKMPPPLYSDDAVEVANPNEGAEETARILAEALPGTFTHIAGEPGVGKTSGVLLAAQRGLRVAVAEPTLRIRDELHDRMTSSGVRSSRILSVQDGCLVEGLGLAAAERGSGRGMCQGCQLRAQCPAQVREEESANALLFTHALLPSIARGGEIRDRELLDSGKVYPLRGRVLIIDEIPSLFRESEVQRDVLRNILSRQWSTEASPVRPGKTVSEDIHDLVQLLIDLANAIHALISQSNEKYPERLTLGEIRDQLVRLLDDRPGVRRLLKLGKVSDPGGRRERSVIPEPFHWSSGHATRVNTASYMTKFHGEESVVRLFKALAALAIEDERDRHKAMLKHGFVRATVKAHAALSVAEVQPWIPDPASGQPVVLMAAEAAAYLPIIEAMAKAAGWTVERKSLRLKRRATQHVRHLFTKAVTAEAIRIGFSDGSSEDSRDKILSPLSKALGVTGDEVTRRLGGGRHKLLLGVPKSLAAWLRTDDGEAWLDEHLPENLELDTGGTDGMGSLLHHGGPSRGENGWRDKRVSLSFGDAMPEINGVKQDLAQLELAGVHVTQDLDALTFAEHQAQALLGQFHGRTRPAGAEDDTVSIHTGRILPQSFPEAAGLQLRPEILQEAARRADVRTFEAQVSEALRAAERPLCPAELATALGVDQKQIARKWETLTQANRLEAVYVDGGRALTLAQGTSEGVATQGQDLIQEQGEDPYMRCCPQLATPFTTPREGLSALKALSGHLDGGGHLISAAEVARRLEGRMGNRTARRAAGEIREAVEGGAHGAEALFSVSPQKVSNLLEVAGVMFDAASEDVQAAPVGASSAKPVQDQSKAPELVPATAEDQAGRALKAKPEPVLHTSEEETRKLLAQIFEVGEDLWEDALRVDEDEGIRRFVAQQLQRARESGDYGLAISLIATKVGGVVSIGRFLESGVRRDGEVFIWEMLGDSLRVFAEHYAERDGAKETASVEPSPLVLAHFSAWPPEEWMELIRSQGWVLENGRVFDPNHEGSEQAVSATA